MTKKVKKSRKPKFDKDKLMEFLITQADRMRKSPTKWELTFKNYLVSLGISFHFQYPIICKTHGFILDFYLPEYQLFIEIDGRSTHASKEQQKRDNLRTRRLKASGLTPLRFWNSQIDRFTPKQIQEIIFQKIKNLKSLEISN